MMVAMHPYKPSYWVISSVPLARAVVETIVVVLACSTECIPPSPRVAIIPRVLAGPRNVK